MLHLFLLILLYALQLQCLCAFCHLIVLIPVIWLQLLLGDLLSFLEYLTTLHRAGYMNSNVASLTSRSFLSPLFSLYKHSFNITAMNILVHTLYGRFNFVIAVIVQLCLFLW